MNIVKLFLSFGICFLVAFLGSLITLPSISTWYVSLNKPFFSPPNWLFGPVWTVLYFSMGLALYLVWNKKAKENANAIKIFFIQLALNLLWSVIFFGFHQPLLAFIAIIALWISIFTTIKYFYKISKWATYVLIPYLIWVSFASILNLAIAVLNSR